jgi:hypothetical protein
MSPKRSQIRRPQRRMTAVGTTNLLIPVARIIDLLDSQRSKKNGRVRRPCRTELVDLYTKSVPARRPGPTNFQGASFVIGHNFGQLLQTDMSEAKNCAKLWSVAKS